MANILITQDTSIIDGITEFSNTLNLKKYAHPQLTYKQSLDNNLSNWITVGAMPTAGAFETANSESEDAALRFKKGDLIGTENYSTTGSSMNFYFASWIKFDIPKDTSKPNYIAIFYEDGSDIHFTIPTSYSLIVWNYFQIIGSSAEVTLYINGIKVESITTLPSGTAMDFNSKSCICIGNYISYQNSSEVPVTLDNTVLYSGIGSLVISSYAPSDYITSFTGNNGSYSYTDYGNKNFALY